MANMTLWNPEDDFQQMRRMVNRLAGGSLFGAASDPFREVLGAGGGVGALALSPAVEIEDLGEAFRVRCEIPGVREDDVQIMVTGGVLTIRGEKRYERTVGGNGGQQKPQPQTGEPASNGGSQRPIFSERAYGSFERIITLPDEVDAQKVDATFENGVLEVVLPRRADMKPRQIQVKVRH